MTLTPEERQRIYEEEKARIEARDQIEADAQRQFTAQQAEAARSVAQQPPVLNKGTHPLFLIALVAVAIIFISVVGASMQDTPSVQAPLTVPTTPPPTAEEARRRLDEYRSLHKLAHPSQAQYDKMQDDLDLISTADYRLVTGFNNNGHALGLTGEPPLGNPPLPPSAEQMKREAKKAARSQAKADDQEAHDQALRAQEEQEDQAAYARIKAKLREDYPTSYSTQKMLYDANVEAYHYMKTVSDLKLKAKLEEDYPASYSTQQMLYDANIKDKQALDGE